MIKTLFFTLLTSLLFFVHTNSWADMSTDRAAEKIFIDADHMQLNIETGYSIYTGNVKITQGELKLTGDKVTVQQNDNEIKHITVIGKPAHYNHVTEAGEKIQAESERMVYIASENKLVLTINAKLKQPDHQVSSQKIVYDTEKKLVIAGDKNANNWSGLDADENSKQRVNITLTPKKQAATKNK
ncbi:hypothetical protein MNBD_GAMMA06-448 [hydrothermal vent metagenome]|uniref:Organic solvent tolerance-like N-terminal domain-containing protein n=1 Tax=hydrothermal vent metagenome TaxID=652676 RepID=A0A3B0WEH7_9ZZZZ